MDITMLADHIVEASTGRLKQEVIEAEIESRKVGISSDVRLLSGYLGEVERWGSHICISYCIAVFFFFFNKQPFSILLYFKNISFPQVSKLQTSDSQPQAKLSLRARGSAKSSG